MAHAAASPVRAKRKPIPVRSRMEQGLMGTFFLAFPETSASFPGSEGDRQLSCRSQRRLAGSAFLPMNLPRFLHFRVLVPPGGMAPDGRGVLCPQWLGRLRVSHGDKGEVQAGDPRQERGGRAEGRRWGCRRHPRERGGLRDRGGVRSPRSRRRQETDPQRAGGQRRGARTFAGAPPAPERGAP